MKKILFASIALGTLLSAKQVYMPNNGKCKSNHHKIVVTKELNSGEEHVTYMTKDTRTGFKKELGIYTAGGSDSGGMSSYDIAYYSLKHKKPVCVQCFDAMCNH